MNTNAARAAIAERLSEQQVTAHIASERNRIADEIERIEADMAQQIERARGKFRDAERDTREKAAALDEAERNLQKAQGAHDWAATNADRARYLIEQLQSSRATQVAKLRIQLKGIAPSVAERIKALHEERENLAKGIPLSRNIETKNFVGATEFDVYSTAPTTAARIEGLLQVIKEAEELASAERDEAAVLLAIDAAYDALPEAGVGVKVGTFVRDKW